MYTFPNLTLFWKIALFVLRKKITSICRMRQKVPRERARKATVEGKAIPVQVLRAPEGWAYEGGKVVSPTHRPPLPHLPTHFCQRMGQPQDQREAGRIMSMKNPSDNIGNRTRNHKACSVVPKPSHRGQAKERRNYWTAPHRTPK